MGNWIGNETEENKKFKNKMSCSVSGSDVSVYVLLSWDSTSVLWLEEWFHISVFT